MYRRADYSGFFATYPVPGARRVPGGLDIIAHDRSMLSGDAFMHQLKLSRVFTLIEPGPVVLVTTCDGNKNNVMTISWTMVLDFSPVFAITTGAWKLFLRGFTKNQGVRGRHSNGRPTGPGGRDGTCSGADTDKFAKFKLTAVPGKPRQRPLIEECLANIECKVVDLVDKHNIVVLEAGCGLFGSRAQGEAHGSRGWRRNFHRRRP